MKKLLIGVTLVLVVGACLRSVDSRLVGKWAKEGKLEMEITKDGKLYLLGGMIGDDIITKDGYIVRKTLLGEVRRGYRLDGGNLF